MDSIIMDARAANALREGIVKQAIKDYEYALVYMNAIPKNLNQHYRKTKAISMYYDTLKFFHSSWYNALCQIDADRLIKVVTEFYCNYDCSIFSDSEKKKKKKRKVTLDYEKVVSVTKH